MMMKIYLFEDLLMKMHSMKLKPPPNSVKCIELCTKTKQWMQMTVDTHATTASKQMRCPLQTHNISVNKGGVIRHYCAPAGRLSRMTLQSWTRCQKLPGSSDPCNLYVWCMGAMRWYANPKHLCRLDALIWNVVRADATCNVHVCNVQMHMLKLTWCNWLWMQL